MSNVAPLRALASKRWRMAIALSAWMIVLYFGFILLIAFDKEAMGRPIAPGLSLGIILGALVIVLTWVTTWFYVTWANNKIDAEVNRQNRVPS